MGRNFLSSTELVHQVIADLKPFADMLPPQDRLIFNQFSQYALNNRAAIANAATFLPLEATLLIVLLEEHKSAQRMYAELRAEIALLRKAIQHAQDSSSGNDASP